MILTILLTVVVALDVALSAYLLQAYLNPKDTPMITQDEQAIVDAVRGMKAKADAADAAIAAANQATAEAQQALATETADHAELVSALQQAMVVVPA